MAETVKPDRWGFDKKIPIAVIIALVVQFIGTIGYVVNLDNRVASLEKAITAQSTKEGERNRGDLILIERMARVEEKLGALLDYVRRIDRDGRRDTP